MAGQGVRIAGHAQQQPAFLVCQQFAERTKDRIAAARAHGKRPGRQPLDPDKIAAALKLVKAGLSPTAARQAARLGTVHRVSRGRPGRYRENPLACHLSCSWKVLP
jgi:hypothetical protein